MTQFEQIEQTIKRELVGVIFFVPENKKKTLQPQQYFTVFFSSQLMAGRTANRTRIGTQKHLYSKSCCT
jgi:hypothetical protein